MAVDPWAGSSVTITGPAERHYPVTPGPDELDPRPRALRIGGAGTVTVEDAAGVAIVYPCAAGEVLTFRAVKVTSATATDIVAWY